MQDRIDRDFDTTVDVATQQTAELEAAYDIASSEVDDAQARLTEEEKKAKAEDLFRRMGFLRKPFLRTLEYALEPRGADELEERIAEFVRYNKSGYGPSEIRLMLEAGSCLEKQASVADTEGAALDQASEDQASEILWQTTPIGESFLNREDPAPSRIRELLTGDAKILQGYGDAMRAIQEGTGAFKEIEEAIKSTSLYQVDNKHASMFLKRLEEVGAIEWKGRWTVTSAGDQVLEGLIELG